MSFMPIDAGMGIRPSKLECTSRLLEPIRSKIGINIILFHAFFRIKGMAIVIVNNGMKDKSTAAINHAGTEETSGRIRPEVQIIDRSNNGQPWSVRIEVQFPTAVNKKPATTAIVYPNNISWPCQIIGE